MLNELRIIDCESWRDSYIRGTSNQISVAQEKITLSTHLWSVAGKMLLEQILFAWLLSPLETNLFMVNK